MEHDNCKGMMRNLMIGIFLISFIVVPVSAKLATPTMITPPNNYHAYNTWNLVFLAWKPVSGATAYFFEFQYYSAGAWQSFSSGYIYGQGDVAPLDRNYKWRFHLRAFDGNPANTSGFSPWLMIDFKDPKVQLATPTLLSPIPAVTFSYSALQGFYAEWKPVIGADQYQLYAQYKDQGSGSWVSLSGYPKIIKGNGPFTTMAEIAVPSPLQGRWCVAANDSKGYWMNSTTSTWRTFTFKA